MAMRRLRLGIPALAALTFAASGAAAQAPSDSVGYWDLPTGSHIAWVRVAGARGAELPPLVYVHGGPGAYEVRSFGVYRRFAEQWARLGFDVYFYDQVGSGLSGRLSDPTRYTVARHVADLEAIRVRIGAARLVLIGESWGATLVSHYIAAHPGVVERAVFVSPGVIDRRDWEAPPASLHFDAELLAWVRSHRPAADVRLCLALDRRMGRDVRAAHAWAGDSAMDELLDGWLSGQILAKAVADTSKLRSATMHGTGFWAWTMTNRDMLTRAARVRPVLRRFGEPVLILRGSADYLPVAIAAQYAATFPHATLVRVPGAGHLIWVDRPGTFADEIERFLAPAAAGR